MAADVTRGNRGQPQYSALGGMDAGADETQLADYASEVGTRRVGPTTARLALAGLSLFVGLRHYDTTLKREFEYTDTGWAPVGALFGVGAGYVGGTPPTTAVILEQVGFLNIPTGVTGNANVPYPKPFPNGVLHMTLTRVDYANYGVTDEILAATQLLTRCDFRVYDAAGNAVLSAPGIPYSYRAIGW